MSEEPKLPLGASDWREPTADELAEQVKTTDEAIDAAKGWTKKVGGTFAELLDAEPYDA